MTDRRYAISIKGVFSGIYEWGTGFVSREVRDKWNQFWKVEFPKRAEKNGWWWWKYANGDGFGECGHLSAIAGSVYLHPMDFSTTLISTGGVVCISLAEKTGKEYFNHFSGEISSLKKICEECAEFCGGSFWLFISPEFRIEVERPTIDYGKVEDVSEYGIEKQENEYIY